MADINVKIEGVQQVSVNGGTVKVTYASGTSDVSSSNVNNVLLAMQLLAMTGMIAKLEEIRKELETARMESHG